MYKKIIVISLLLLLTGCSSSNTISSDDNMSTSTDDNIPITVDENVIEKEVESSTVSREEETNSDKEAIIVESIEPHLMDISGYASCDISFRNISGQRLKIISLDVAFLDENGDITESTYPQYPGSVADEQACSVEILYQEIPRALQVSSVSYYDMKDNYTQLFFETPYTFEIK